MLSAKAEIVYNGNLVNWHCGCHGWHFKAGEYLMLESWLVQNALVIAGFIGTGGAALWRIQALEKRMEKQSVRMPARTGAASTKSRRRRRWKWRHSRASYAGAASLTARGSKGSGTMVVRAIKSLMGFDLVPMRMTRSTRLLIRCPTPT